MTKIKKENLITILAYAKLCGVEKITIYKRIEAGDINPVKKGSATFINIDTTPVVLRQKSGRKSAEAILSQK